MHILVGSDMENLVFTFTVHNVHAYHSVLEAQGTIDYLQFCMTVVRQ